MTNETTKQQTPWKRANTDWMRDARWGVMVHFLSDPPSFQHPADVTADEWNKRVEGFDLPRFVRQIQDVGAGYLIFTLGQSSGFFCSPNATYDGIVGENPSRLSRRDLMGELAEALAPTGIRLIAYLPAHAPGFHPRAVEALRCTPPWDASLWHGSYVSAQPADERLSDFQRNWESVIREWSLRWGRNVHGWWIDGCYYPDQMYRHTGTPNFRSFADALKTGNPESVVAFNPGVLVPIISHTEFEDYTAGEANVLVTPNKFHGFQRFIDGAQFHVLSFLGDFWCVGEPRYPDHLVVEYTRYINGFDGAVTWDVPILPDGRIPDVFSRQLSVIGRSCSPAK
ncbi:MAG: hypothetical protein WC003_14590 [Terrimicrobiaceae bacterium]